MLDKVLELPSLENVMNHTRWMFEEVPERISGWEAATKAANYLTENLKISKLDAFEDYFQGLVSHPREGTLEIIGYDNLKIKAMTFAQSTSTPKEGITAELVYVGAGGEADYQGKNVEGKLVVADLSYAPPRPEKTRIATNKGAIGIILANWGDEDSPLIPRGTVKSVWGNPSIDTIDRMPKIPSIGIPKRDGIAIQKLIQQNPKLTGRITARADREWRTLNQPHGILKSVKKSNDWLLLGGHMDSWGGGATDNGTGNAVTLEVARILAENREYLRRDVHVSFWQAHENGIMEGSSWFVDNYWDQITEGMIAYVNIDTLGMLYAEQFKAKLSPELWTFHKQLMKRVLGYTTDPIKLPKTGDQSFMGVGVPSIVGRSEFPKEKLEQWGGAVLGPWYHSEDDTLEVIDKDKLQQDIRMTMAYAWEFATRPILPYDFRHNAKILRDTLNQYQQIGDGSIPLEDSISYAEKFENEIQKIYTHSELVNTSIVKGDPSGELASQADLLNENLKKLSRVITPLLTSICGRYDQDSYGLSSLTKWIPKLAGMEGLSKFKIDSGEHTLHWTKLIRERNHVTDSAKSLMHVSKNLSEQLNL